MSTKRHIYKVDYYIYVQDKLCGANNTIDDLCGIWREWHKCGLCNEKDTIIGLCGTTEASVVYVVHVIQM
jgi:hypothetical protein